MSIARALLIVICAASPATGAAASAGPAAQGEGVTSARFGASPEEKELTAGIREFNRGKCDDAERTLARAMESPRRSTPQGTTDGFISAAHGYRDNRLVPLLRCRCC
jgi:hypothetical protein